MNTDKPDVDECISSYETEEVTPPEKNSWLKPYFVAVLLGLAAFFAFYLVTKLNSETIHTCCQDNLRTIDSAIALYEIEHGDGVFPASPEDLLPEFFRNIPECPDGGGTYSMDTNTINPRAVCSKGHTY